MRSWRGISPVYILLKRTKWRAIPSSQHSTVCCMHGGAWLQARIYFGANSSGKFHCHLHVEDEGDKVDGLALLPLFVGVAR